MTESNDRSAAGEGRNVLFFACSGAANVAEAADRACRRLTYEGDGNMFCLAGLGAGIPDMVQAAKDADLNVVVDGCDVDCGRKILDDRGVKNYVQIRVTDLDIEKVKGAAATDGEVAVVVKRVKKELSENQG